MNRRKMRWKMKPRMTAIIMTTAATNKENIHYQLTELVRQCGTSNYQILKYAEISGKIGGAKGSSKPKEEKLCTLKENQQGLQELLEQNRKLHELELGKHKKC